MQLAHATQDVTEPRFLIHLKSLEIDCASNCCGLALRDDF